MRTVSQSSKSGVALIMVMVAIFALSVLVGAFAYAMKVETRLAQTSNNGETLIWLGRSGVEQAKSILAQANCPYAALNQKWAGGSGSECETNGAFTDLPMKNVPLGEGTFSITITDLERKININRNNPNSEALLRNAIDSIGLSQGEAAMVQDGILDWMDPNPNSNVKHPNGAKTDYYQSLEPPYNAKNGPVDDISELLMIRGISQDNFWGPNSPNHSPAYFQRNNQSRRATDQPMYSAGLEDIFTTMGGPVNINTASREVLLAIPGINETIADQIIQNRNEAPFEEIGYAITSAGAPPNISTYCGVKSLTFEVQVDAEAGGTRRTFYAIVARAANPKKFEVLSFYWK